MPNYSGQKQFSPNNIHTLSRDKDMRIKKMITKGKMPWSFIKFSQVILKKIYGDKFGEFVCGYWGLKGWGQSVTRTFSKKRGTSDFVITCTSGCN